MDLPLPLRVQGRVSRLGEMGDTPERGAPLGLVGAVRAKVGQYLRYLVAFVLGFGFGFGYGFGFGFGFGLGLGLG